MNRLLLKNFDCFDTDDSGSIENYVWFGAGKYKTLNLPTKMRIPLQGPDSVATSGTIIQLSICLKTSNAGLVLLKTC